MNDKIYRKLQRHLDRQPVGFPRDRSGSDIRLLERHFTPEEAEIALAMTYRYEIVEDIYARLKKKSAGHSYDYSPGSLTERLDTMSRKISIMQKEVNGIMHYCLVPLVIGMYEGMVFNMDAGYIESYDRYAHSAQHGLSFLSTEVPQMRTIPIEAAIPTDNEVMKFDDVKEHIESTNDPIFIIECTCRKRKKIHGEPCLQTKRSETCMVFGDIARIMLKFHQGREISKTEAVGIIRENQKEGLVLQTYNMQKPEVICSCCGCCCEILNIQKMLPNPRIFSSSNYHAVINPEKCKGCRLCEKKCQVNALKFDKKTRKVSVIEKRCIGCGNCVTACKVDALKLEKNKTLTIPPLDFEDLQETIMRKKPIWRLGRIIRRSFTR